MLKPNPSTHSSAAPVQPNTAMIHGALNLSEKLSKRSKLQQCDYNQDQHHTETELDAPAAPADVTLRADGGEGPVDNKQQPHC